MRDPISPFSINCHSSIRWGGAVTVWFDPFRVENATGDGDVIFITHDHYDHFSPEDIRRVMKPDAVLVLPESCRAAALAAGFSASQLLPVRAGEHYTVKGIPFTSPSTREAMAGWAMWRSWTACGSMCPATPTTHRRRGRCPATRPSCRWAAPTP